MIVGVVMEKPDISSLPKNIEAEQALLGAILANNKAFEKVSTGQITFAARDADYDGPKIKKDDLMAIENGKAVFTETINTYTITKNH